MCRKKIGLMIVIMAIICVLVTGCPPPPPPPTPPVTIIVPGPTITETTTLPPTTITVPVPTTVPVTTTVTVTTTIKPSPTTNIPLSLRKQAADYLSQLYNPLIGLCSETSTSEPQPESITDSKDNKTYSSTSLIHIIALVTM